MTEETLFAEVLELPPEERSAFLDEACGDDAELRERIEVLLRSHNEANAPGLRASDDDREVCVMKNKQLEGVSDN